MKCKRERCAGTVKRGCFYCPLHNPLHDPEWRKARGRAAGDAARRAHTLRALERAAGMLPAEAYTVGYRTGYNRAYHFWQAWAKKGRRAA